MCEPVCHTGAATATLSGAIWQLPVILTYHYARIRAGEAGIDVASTVPRQWPRVRIPPDECYFDQGAKKAAAMVTATASLLVIINRVDCTCQFVPGVT